MPIHPLRRCRGADSDSLVVDVREYAVKPVSKLGKGKGVLKIVRDGEVRRHRVRGEVLFSTNQSAISVTILVVPDDSLPD